MNQVQLYQPPYPPYPGVPSPPRSGIAMAHAAGDFRHNMKQFDRAGMSRGAGQTQQAGIQASKQVADGIAEAYGQQAADAAAYGNQALAAEQGQEQFSQALGALQQQSAYANAMAQLQQINALRGLMT